MTEPTLIESQKTWLPLMAVQRRRRDVGYQMPVRGHESGSAAMAAGIEARRRLMSGQSARPAPPPATVVIAAPAVAPAAPVQRVPRRVPLNMLAEPSWKFLVRLAAIRHGVRVSDNLSNGRSREKVAARHEAIGLVYSHSDRTIPQVGRIFDRDHSTIENSLFKSGTKVRRSQMRATIIIGDHVFGADAS